MLSNLRRFVPDAGGRDHAIARHGHLPDPRVFRSHHPVYPERYRRILYLVRDPRAVLVSLWHHYRVARNDRVTTPEELVDVYLSSDQFEVWLRDLDRWDRHVTRFALDPAPGSVPLIVRYEDLVEDRRGELERVAAFLEITPGPESLAVAVERGAFGAMRRAEDRHGVEHFRKLKLTGERFVRSGKTRGWREELSPEAAGRIERRLGPVMERLGYL